MSFEKNLCVLCELCVSVLKKNQHKGTKVAPLFQRKDLTHQIYSTKYNLKNNPKINAILQLFLKKHIFTILIFINNQI